MPRSGFAYAMPLFFAIEDCVLVKFMKKCRLSGPEGVGVTEVPSWQAILYASRSSQVQWGRRKTTKTHEMGGKRIGVANGNCFLQGSRANITPRQRFVNSLTRNVVGFHEHSLPASFAVMFYSGLILVRFSVFLLCRCRLEINGRFACVWVWFSVLLLIVSWLMVHFSRRSKV